MKKLTPNHFITEEAREAYLALLEAIEEEGGGDIDMTEVKEWLMDGEPGTSEIMRIKELAEHIIYRITLETQEEV